MRPIVRAGALTLLVALAAAACEEEATAPDSQALTPEAPSFARRAGSGTAVDQSPVPKDLSFLNEPLAKKGLAVAYYEYVTAPGSGEYGRTVFASDRGNKQLFSDWVPGDPRRGGGPGINYIVDQTEGAANPGLSNADTEGAIDRAMSTWNSQTCSNIPITKLPSSTTDLGVVQWLLGFGGVSFALTDLTHAGWLPKAFFNTGPIFPPNGGDFILGVTFTFIFLDGSGNPTDINSDGKIDTAFREIYYNDNFAWTINNMPFLGPPFDVETVVLHESGHGLSQGHFGDIFVDGGFRFLHFAPFAVMNAAISRQAHELTGTDLAGHCSIWGNWPNN